MLYCFPLVCIQFEGLFHQAVTFHQLAGGKADRDACGCCVIFDQMHHAVQASVHRAAVVFLVAEVLARRLLLVLRHVNCVFHQLFHALFLCRGDWHHRDSQDALHLVYADASAVAAELIHHIERQYHRDLQLHKLDGQIQVALNVVGICDVNDAFHVLLQDEAAGNYFLRRVRRQGIDSRQVRDAGLRMAFDNAVLAVHGHAGEVAHVLVGARQDIEQRSLAAVLLSCQGKRQRSALWQRVLVVLGVVFSRLAKSRMGVVLVQGNVICLVVLRGCG